MNTPFLHQLLILFFSLTLVSCTNFRDTENFGSRKSPIAIAKLNYEDTYIKIVYGQPYKKGRVIFGNLVPYGEVWRTGANEATEITTTQDININGNRLLAGTYSLFSIPDRSFWTIILNSKLGQWGAFNYDREYDILRTDVPVSKTENITEAFTITFSNIENEETTIDLKWDSVIVSIPVSFRDFTDPPTNSNP